MFLEWARITCLIAGSSAKLATVAVDCLPVVFTRSIHREMKREIRNDHSYAFTLLTVGREKLLLYLLSRLGNSQQSCAGRLAFVLLQSASVSITVNDVCCSSSRSCFTSSSGVSSLSRVSSSPFFAPEVFGGLFLERPRFAGDFSPLVSDTGSALVVVDVSFALVVLGVLVGLEVLTTLGFATTVFVAGLTIGFAEGFTTGFGTLAAAAGVRCTVRIPGLLPVAIRDASARVVLITGPGTFLTGFAFGVDSSSELSSGELMMVLRGGIGGWTIELFGGRMWHARKVVYLFQSCDCYALLVAFLVGLDSQAQRRVHSSDLAIESKGR